MWYSTQGTAERYRRGQHLLRAADGTPLVFDAASGLVYQVPLHAHHLLRLRQAPAAEAHRRCREAARRLDRASAFQAVQLVAELDTAFEQSTLPPPPRFPLPRCGDAKDANAVPPTVRGSLVERAITFLARHTGVSEDALRPSLTDGAYPRPRLEAAGAGGVRVSLSLPTEAARELTVLSAQPSVTAQVPLDGPEEIHERHRALAFARPSYSEALEAMARARAVGRQVRLSAELTALSVDPIAVFRHLQGLAPDEIAIKPIKVPGHHPLAITESNLPGVCAGYRAFADFLCGLTRVEAMDVLKILSDTDYFKRFLLRVARRTKLGYRCMAAKTMIDADGRGVLYPCSSFTRSNLLPIGTLDHGVDRERIDTLIEGAYVDNKPVCKDCWARYLCGGGCYYLATTRTGNPLIPDPVDCKLVRSVAELSIATLHGLEQSHPGIVAECLLRA
jgi:radical SAM protein with 4Fe4S-binding SPASM domain